MSNFEKLENLLQKPLRKYNLAHPVAMMQLCAKLQQTIEAEFPTARDQIKVQSLRHQTFKILAPAALAPKIALSRLIILKKTELDEDFQFRFVSVG